MIRLSRSLLSAKFFLCFALLTYSSAYAAPQGQAALPDDVVKTLLKPHQQPGNALSEQLTQHLQEAGELIEEAVDEDKKQQAGTANMLSSKQQLLDAKRADIDDLRQNVQAELDQTRAKLVQLKLSAQVDAFDRYTKQVNQRFDRINRSLTDFASEQKEGPRRQALSKVKAELNSLHTPVGTTDAVPGNFPTPTTRLGAEVKRTPAQPSKNFPQYLSAVVPTIPSTPNYAFLLDFLGKQAQAAAPATPSQAVSCGYAAGDLAATEDVVISQDILNLAAQLNYSPVKIYQYVYNTIKYEPYFGSLKGSAGTFYSNAGGATDQASLLIALLRASNIPARYVQGDIQLIDASNLGANGRAPLWIGAKTYQAAASILATNLNPNAAVINNSGGSPVGIQLRHVWVEACLPYGNYRGAAADNSGYRWLPLDPSFKGNTYQSGIANIQQNVPFDYSATIGTGYLSARTNTLPHEKFETLVDTYIKSLNSNNSLLDVPYLGQQVARSFDILPVTLPYDVVQYDNWAGTTSPEAANLPVSHRYQFTIKVQDSSQVALLPDQQLSIPSIVHKRVTLSYTPADANSQTIWNSWNGDLASIPAGLVNLNPVIKIDGTPLVTGTGIVKLGGSISHNLVMKVTLGDTTLQQPSCRNDIPTNTTPDSDLHCFNKTVYTNLKGGSLYAVMAYARQGSDRLLSERSNLLIQAVQGNATPPTPANAANYDATEGELLHVALLKYLRHVTEGGQRIGQLNGVSGESGTHLGLTAAGLQTSYLFDLPYTVHPSGPYIDVLGNLSHFVKLDTTATTGAALQAEIWPTFKLAAYSASAYEHFIWQEMINTDAVSTVRGLQFAGETANSLVTLNSANIGSWATLMDAGMSAYQANITSYVTDGATVTVPNKAIAYTDGQAQPKKWNGAIYMVENQTKGYIAAMINGSMGGGYSLLNYTPASLLYNYDGYTPTAVSSGGLFNSTTLTNGITWLTTTAGDPVNIVTGNFYHNERDVSVSGRGLPLVFERNYNSRNPKDGPLGFGWTHSFNHRLNFYGVDGSYVKVGWLDGSGAERFFRIAGTTVPVSSTFQSAPGVYSILKREADGSWSVTEKNGFRYGFENNAGATAGTLAKLLTIKDRNLNTLTLSYNADQTLNTVTDGPGRTLAFTYTTGRITQLAVKAAVTGTVLETTQYGYDANFNLTSYKSPLAVTGQHNPVSYAYYSATDGQNLNHALKTFTQPQGEGMQFYYYQDGRVFQHQRQNNGVLLAETTTFRYNEYRRETVTVNERGFERRHTFDANGNPIRIVDETGAAYTYNYDPANPFNRLSQTDPSGLKTQYSYDTVGNVLSIIQPNAATTQYLDFTAYNAPQRIQDANGNWTLLAYDGKGNLTDRIRLDNGITPIANTTPALANIASWSKQAYDPLYGQPTQSKTLRVFTGAVLGSFATGSGPTVTTTYDTNVLYPTQISRLGDKNGDGLINAADPADNAALTYDTLGRTTQGIDADWQTVNYTYDADNQVLTGTDAAGQQRKFQFDGDGRPVGAELELTQNSQTRLWDSAYRSYDPAGRLKQSLDAGGNAMQYQYDAAGNQTLITDPDNYTLGYSYDPANRWIKAYDKAGHNVSRSLDAAGRQKTFTDANGNTTTYSYWDATQNGRLKQVAQPAVAPYTGGVARQFSYDKLGQLIQTTDVPAAGSTETSRTTLSVFDAVGRLLRTAGPQITDSDPSSATFNQLIRPLTRYSYDNLGQLLNIQAGKTSADGGASINPNTGISANDNVAIQVSYVHDDFGRTLSETDANGQIARYTYDLNSNTQTAQTANGHTLNYVWGYGHQLQSLTAEDGRKIQYIRNPLGQITHAETWSANPSSTLDVAYDYSFDPSHRPANVTDGRGYKVISYGWSPGGQLNNLTDPDNNLTEYLYDPVGRLISLWASNYDTYGFAYDNGGRLKQVIYPNGVNETLSWNSDNTLSQISHKNGATVIEQSQYSYDGLSRRKTNLETISGTALTNTYQYDPLDRLSSVDNGTAAQKENYGYDNLNNRVQKQVGTNTLAYKFDAANQLTETHQTNLTGSMLEAYLYDNSGNQSQKCTGTTVTRASNAACTGGTVQGYVYNSFNRLAQYNGAITGTYRYDDQGRRIQKVEGANAVNYLYDGKDIYSEYPTNSWSTPNAAYVQAGTDHPLARLTGNIGDPTAIAAYYHQDGLGSVLATTNAAKVVTASQRFNAFGTSIATSGTIPQYGYTGREPDASGMIYYRARYNDANGRFTQRDPLGYADGINRYAYVGNNPINFNDPNGLWANQISNAITPSISYFTSGQFSAQLQTSAIALNDASANNQYLGITVRPAQNSINQAANGDASGFMGQVALVAATGGAYKPGSVVTNAPGTWTSVNESMSAQSAAYQAKVTGANTGTAYVVNGVKFDGYQNGVLLDAKANYAQFVNKNTGEFQSWFTGSKGLVDQAVRQLGAADGTPIQWNFAEESAANAAKALLQKNSISGIEIVHVP